jgi:hypothetical protein
MFGAIDPLRLFCLEMVIPTNQRSVKLFHKSCPGKLGKPAQNGSFVGILTKYSRYVGDAP